MGKSLIIVESPTKIKTLKQFLGAGYLFASSFGHIRDLPAHEFGIDVEHGFEPKYDIVPGKAKVVTELKKLAKQCDEVLLATDPDREGEAIAWHIGEILPKGTKFKRVTFHEITKDAVRKAIASPKMIEAALVDAQQTRRLLDRLVGYTISPLFNKRMRRGRGKSVSAGRVQSVALKMIVDREREIEAFVPIEYWTIEAKFQDKIENPPFTAQLFSVDGKKIEKEIPLNKKEGVDVERIETEEKSKFYLDELKTCSYVVESVEKKERKRNPEPPFITSTLQQEASRHFRFSPAKTMQIAQQLYEGVDLGEKGTEGLITYMRTDSVRLSNEALQDIRGFILKTYGQQFLPHEPRVFVVKKSAQDAHEAIRVTSIENDLDRVEPFLTRDQFLLYSLIWKRSIACQMMPAIYDTATVDIRGGKRFILRATGSIIKFLGFLSVYEEKRDESEEAADKDLMLPQLEEKSLLKLLELLPHQSFTKPPPRFSEASLIKELEKSGIGRPSTYAAIMNKIQSRDYTEKVAARLKPTELGRLLTDMLVANFKKIVSIDFTAHMEDDLELIAECKKQWREVLAEFWKDFKETLDIAEVSAEVPKIMTDIPCPKCGGHLQKIWSKSKYFLGCEKYPECDYRTSLEEATFNKADYADNFDWDQACPKCQTTMKVRFGRFGPFLGCTKYPECRGIINIPKKGEEATVLAAPVSCPADTCTGHLSQKRSRFGKMYYLCSEFPACDVIGNDVDKIREKYTSRTKTAYVKKEKSSNKPQKERRPEMAVKKKAAVAKKKPAAKKKTVAKKKK